MLSRYLKRIVLLLIVLLMVATPMSLAQAPSAISLYSIWVRLSLRGYSQHEIESVLRNMDSKAMEDVKNRLRATVLAQLQLKKIRQQLDRSRDKDDLNNVISSVETEIRFAGMQNDDLLKLMIKDRYGLRLDRF